MDDADYAREMFRRQGREVPPYVSEDDLRQFGRKYRNASFDATRGLDAAGYNRPGEPRSGFFSGTVDDYGDAGAAVGRREREVQPDKIDLLTLGLGSKRPTPPQPDMKQALGMNDLPQRLPNVADVQARLKQKKLMEMLAKQGGMNMQMADDTLQGNQDALQARRNGIQSKVYDDIGDYARQKQAQELKQRYQPEPEPAGDELSAPPMVDAPDEDLDDESLQRLAAMAGE
jgi:hypothetical protein